MIGRLKLLKRMLNNGIKMFKYGINKAANWLGHNLGLRVVPTINYSSTNHNEYGHDLKPFISDKAREGYNELKRINTKN